MVRIGEPVREYIREPAPHPVEPFELPAGDPANPAPEREPEEMPADPFVDPATEPIEPAPERVPVGPDGEPIEEEEEPED